MGVYGIAVLSFFFERISIIVQIFLRVLRYWESLMSPSMMEGLVLRLFCLRKSCSEDLSERVSRVAHLCKSFHTRCNFPQKWVVYHLQIFPENQVRNQMEHDFVGATEHLLK